MLSTPTAKDAYVTGAHRTRHPEETWNAVRPLLARFGITRVADVTGLDALGIPVMMAVRPLATTVSVSQGKGASSLAAKVSAVMEGVELWHAEQVHPPLTARSVSARDLQLPYQYADLITSPGALVTENTPLDWVGARGLRDGAPTHLPLDTVCFLPAPSRRPQLPGIGSNTNGLASGNCRAEAALHGLYEIVERDALSGPTATGPAERAVDPATVDDPVCAELIRRIAAAGAWLHLTHVPNRFGVPCYTAHLWSEDVPLRCFGAGAHGTPAIALSRAITEAAQSRLTAIAGTRDDIPPIYDQVRHADAPRPEGPRDTVPYPATCADPPPAFTDVDRELAWVGERVATVTGQQPLVVDLSTEDAFAVVKVVAPGAGLDTHRMHPADAARRGAHEESRP
ncbi:YcaO-like family protein [Streptomyces sp. NPDC021093]|uniref:YcaO-like family protein n=1 Tax=Streptomyces sp. NPDC021093 TaxID=3365112 RepID=UPI0037BB3298